MAALNIQKGASSHSAYDLRDPNSQVEESHTLAVLVENEPGVLARVIGLFAGRGYNIDSLTVAEVDHLGHRSRITIVTRGTPAVIEQIKAQLGRLVPVHDVHDLTVEGASVQRELALIKVRADATTRGQVIEAVDFDFNTLLELGFRSSIEKEWKWRLSRGESLKNLKAFEHLRPE